MFFKVAWIDLNGPQEIRDWDFADLHISLVSSLAAALRALLLLPLATAGLAVRACVRADGRGCQAMARRTSRDEPGHVGQRAGPGVRGTGGLGDGRVLADGYKPLKVTTAPILNWLVLFMWVRGMFDDRMKWDSSNMLLFNREKSHPLRALPLCAFLSLRCSSPVTAARAPPRPLCRRQERRGGAPSRGSR